MKQMDLNVSILTMLYRKAPGLTVFALLLGAAAGALYSFFIPTIIKYIESSATASDVAVPDYTVFLFFAVVLSVLIARVLAVIITNNISKNAAADLKIQCVRFINSLSVRDVEKLGFARLVNILNDDLHNIANAAVNVPMLIVSVVTIFGMLGYLATINVYIFVLITLFLAIGYVSFLIPSSIAGKLYDAARTHKDVIQQGVEGLVYGHYELKLNSKKSGKYIEQEVKSPQDTMVKDEKMADAILHVAGISSDLLSFLVIGIMVFVAPQFISVENLDVYAIVMVLLYIAGPATSILIMMQDLTRGQVSLARLKQLRSFHSESRGDENTSVAQFNDQIELKNIGWSYETDENKRDSSFSISDISLTFKRGEINFIVGGNGSGKSTLAKVISLHYFPNKGQVNIGGTAVTESNISSFRERISVIYTNFHLFQKVYLEGHSELLEERVQDLLVKLQLDGKTSYKDGQFSTIHLSDGQRKRLALLVALLEDRELYVLDEWAADQDPTFKSVFYQEVLQELRKMNKFVVVITHDDRYFDKADKVIKMEDGKLMNIAEHKGM